MNPTVQSARTAILRLAFLTACFIPASQAADLVWDGNVDTRWSELETDMNFFVAGDTEPVFFTAGDNVLFDDNGEYSLGLDIVDLVNPGSVTFNTSGDIITVTGPGSGISGAANIVKSNTNTVTLGGPASNFTGSVSIEGGILKLGNREALGNNSGISISTGGRLDLNGFQPSAAGRNYTVTIAGTGPNSAGAIVNSGNTGTVVDDNAGIQHLVLSGDATIGSVGRYSVGLSGVAAGSITGNGHTLTKVGSAGTIDFRGDTGVTAINFVIANGEAYVRDNDNGWGSSLTIKNGAKAGTNGVRSIATPVTIQNGGTLRNEGGGLSTWTGPFSLSGEVGFTGPNGAASPILITGAVTGTANLVKSGSNTVTINQSGWTGNTSVSNGTLVIPQPGWTGNTTITSSGALTLGQPGLADSSTVSIASGRVITLNYVGQDSVKTLFLGGNLQPPGTYGSNHPTPAIAAYFSGSGELVVPPIPGVSFVFENSPVTNNSVNGTSMAFDSGGTVGTYYPQDGVTLTMVEGLAPSYVNQGSNTYTWDGTSYQASNTNFANWLAISNGSIPGTGDSNNFNPQESWTINFDKDLIIRSINAAAIDSGDMMQVTVGASTFDFVDGDFDANDDKANPFGELVIPAGTSIKFKNSAVYPSFPLTGSNPSAGPAWGLSGFVVEVVPSSGGYDQWAGQIEDEEQVGFDEDADSDGISNGLEYVLGGDPNVSDTEILPTFASIGEAEAEFVFYREEDSLDDTVQTVQYGSDLVGWTDIPVNAEDPPIVLVEDQGGAVSKITVTLEKLAPSMFVRLKVTKSE